MKYMMNYLILLISLLVVEAAHIKLAQLNYRDQYEQCLDDYQKMYKMMENKIKFYTDNENTLLQSVKTTILKAYEKTGESTEKYQKKISELKQELRNIQAQLTSKNAEIANEKKLYESQISKLKSDVAYKNTQNDHLTTSEEVLRQDLKKRNASVDELKYEVADKNKLLAQSEANFNMRLKECTSQVNGISNKYEDQSKKIKEKKNECSKEKEKLVENQLSCNKKLIEEIQKGEKLKTNLELINLKIIKIQEHNSTHLHNYNYNYNDTRTDYNNNSRSDEEDCEDNPDEKPFSNKTSSRKFKDEKFKYFNNIKINRFLEVQSESKMTTKLESKMQTLSEKENTLKSKLDLILFDNINTSRSIYQYLENIQNSLLSFENSKRMCENKLKNSISDNLELKEALAELEINFRLAKVKILNN